MKYRKIPFLESDIKTGKWKIYFFPIFFIVIIFYGKVMWQKFFFRFP